ncbi:MAG TPA: prenyltransferase [Patescibacteria group bacterium]|jgi:4-hydroxybenzoate polyprenyltransferase|nr:prenyltransferase [Patescibacteria group bacterium]
MKKLTLLFATSRPISWVNTAYPFAAGYIVMGGGFDTRLLIGTLFFLVPYNLLMYGINDVFDYESDIRNPRKGSIEGAVTPKAYHPLIIRASVGLSVPFVVYLMLAGSVPSALTLLVVLFFVVAYSAKGLRFKEIPLLDSITSSIHFVGPLVYAYSLVGTNRAGWIAAAAFFAWGIASQAFGAVQDIVPDRQARIRSIATVLGAHQTVRFSLCLYLLASILTMMLGIDAFVVALAGLLYVASIWPYRSLRDADSAQARAGWKRFMWLNYITGAVVTISLAVHLAL